MDFTTLHFCGKIMNLTIQCNAKKKPEPVSPKLLFSENYLPCFVISAMNKITCKEQNRLELRLFLY